MTLGPIGPDELDEHAVGHLRVDERDASAEARTRANNDGDASRHELLSLGVHLRHRERHMVDTFAVSFDELSDGRIVANGLEQLDVRIALIDESAAHPILFAEDNLRLWRVEELLELLHGLFEAQHGDADVVDHPDLRVGGK